MSYELEIVNSVRTPPRDASCEMREGKGFNIGYDRGHGQAKVDARAIARKADQYIAELEKKIKQIHKDLGFELRDPNGTIWQEAARLQNENEQLKQRNAELDKNRNGYTCPKCGTHFLCPSCKGKGIPRATCPKHNYSYQADFTCRYCDAERKEGEE